MASLDVKFHCELKVSRLEGLEYALFNSLVETRTRSDTKSERATKQIATLL